MSEPIELLILQPNNLENQIKIRKHELYLRGIRDPELTRAVMAEFTDYLTPTDIEPWPGLVTGIDLAGNIAPNLIFDSGTPPVIQPNTSKTQPYPTSSTYPNNPTPDPNGIGGQKSHTYDFKNFSASPSDNWSHSASQINSEPSMEGEEGFTVSKSIPEWRYDIEQTQGGISPIDINSIIIEPSGQFNEVSTGFVDKLTKKKKSLLKRVTPWLAIIGGGIAAQSLIDKYFNNAPNEPEEEKRYFSETPFQLKATYRVSSQHVGPDECDEYNGKTFNLLDTTNRPILSIEGLGYTLLHPHCHCKWVMEPNQEINTITRKEESKLTNIKVHIEKAASKGELHTVKADGELSKRTRKSNPLREAIGVIREQFGWMDEDYLNGAKKLAAKQKGKLYLIRAASETITDHRSEGEQLRRKLSGKELNSMARTAIGSKMDINHEPNNTTDATILDSEYNPERREIQMIVMEKDPEINKFIKEGSITAVSINGGAPRNYGIEPCSDNCNGPNCELCNIPKGVILAEIDGIGMTWVVTNPNGILWHGNWIAPAEPGIKSTKIEIL